MDPTEGHTSNTSVDSGENLELESDQETPRPGSDPRQLEVIKARIHDLLSRKNLLLRINTFKRRTWDNGDQEAVEESESAPPSSDLQNHNKGLASVPGDNVNELELIEKELEELLVRMKALEEGGEDLEADTVQEIQSFNHYKPETPCGGIFVLPPYQPEQEGAAPEERVETALPTDPTPPASDLTSCPAVTPCPSCGEFVSTQVKSKVGQATWLVCLLCAMTGCVAGCCLIPFCVEKLKSSIHYCPQCGAHIHTYHPL